MRESGRSRPRHYISTDSADMLKAHLSAGPESSYSIHLWRSIGQQSLQQHRRQTSTFLMTQVQCDLCFPV